MNKTETLYFEALTRDRLDSARTIEKPSMSGVKSTVVEKYSDQAHFIYELLQNADDAGASYARFTLLSDRLIFIHNGTKQFTVTDPDNELEDTQNGTLGDINSITGIGNSNKITESTIGKFGVGFKAVFQYTETPQIYCDSVCFEIRRFIVPYKLEQDLPDRRAGETAFVLPFNHPLMPPPKAYGDILKKLQNLQYPILFLSNLTKVAYTSHNRKESYTTSVDSEYKSKLSTLPETKVQKITCCKSTDQNKIEDFFWLFTRTLEGSSLTYSVGYRIGQDGKLLPCRKPVFCYFPTKVETGLHYIIHGPFLLTDSREGIRSNSNHNIRLIDHLARLAAEALIILKEIGEKSRQYLIDDHILDIIPYKKSRYENKDQDTISFAPFYENTLKVFTNNALIPGRDGKYYKGARSYWASVPELTRLLSDEQLSYITGCNPSHWAFPSLSRDSLLKTDKEKAAYIDEITAGNITEDYLLKSEITLNRKNYWETTITKGIDGPFIEQQPVSWLRYFYRWLQQTKVRKNWAKTAPIILNQNNKACPAFNKKGEGLIFLNVPDMKDTNFVNEQIMKYADCREFMKELGIKEPETADIIRLSIIPRIKEGVIRHKDFQLMFSYFCSTGDRTSEFEGLKLVSFLQSKSQKKILHAPASLYFQTDELLKYFNKNPSYFLDIDYYYKLIPSGKWKFLHSFFEMLGVNRNLKVETIIFQPGFSKASLLNEISQKLNSGPKDRSVFAKYFKNIPDARATKEYELSEDHIAGLHEAINRAVFTRDVELSSAIWNLLLGLGHLNCFKGNCRYYYRTYKERSYTSYDYFLLTEKPWLATKYGEFKTPGSICRDEMASGYHSGPQAEALIQLLGIKESLSQEEKLRRQKEEEQDLKVIQQLSREKQNMLSLGEACAQMNISMADLEAIAAEKKRREEEINIPPAFIDQQADSTPDKEERDLRSASGNEEDSSGHDSPAKRLTSSQKRVFDRLTNLVRHYDESSAVLEPEEIIDYDESFTRPVNLGQKIERMEEKHASEICKQTRISEIYDKLSRTQKYTWQWLQLMIMLEIESGNTDTSDSREISITFHGIKQEPGAKRTFILDKPNRYIPHYVEDLADIPLKVSTSSKTCTVVMEAGSVKDYSLIVKIRDPEKLKEIKLNDIVSVQLEAQSPSFLLQALYDKFQKLKMHPDENLRKNLPENIEFIFGPPGTGKTTYAADQIIRPLMETKKQVKILVLAPTNKAADVLCEKITQLYGDDRPYLNWLIRFGSSSSPYLEEAGVCRARDDSIYQQPKLVLVTTIARFPYDYFMQGNKRIELDSMRWDYILFDEASMIHLSSILYPLYKCRPAMFIVAGDPFQITPVMSVNEWAEENIYRIVQLNSFGNPKTIPHPYKVVTLKTQYRSTKEIGTLFSKFTYEGILNHARQSGPNYDSHLNKTFKIIQFPVEQYESIYRSKRLKQKSCYHIYSALFTGEYIKHLAQHLHDKKIASVEKPINIGIIAPYRTQADLIHKIIEASDLPESIRVEVGTIHSFQGDECEIIAAVLNTPPKITSSKNSFLNRQNILNVAISRARDRLILIMPESETTGFENMFLVNRIMKLIQDIGSYSMEASNSIEGEMFGDSRYLEKNTFVTTHQDVNVYSRPERIYEVRSEDNAIDIQIHNKNETRLNDLSNLVSPSSLMGRINSSPAVNPLSSSKPGPQSVSNQSGSEINRRGQRVYHRERGFGNIYRREGSGDKVKIYVYFEKDGSRAAFRESTVLANHILTYINS